ncbi:type IV secretory system conjugative DNA transfer family protein [Alicyclobacillus tolerans]|uniref:VirD4-like conjugal transfer protein, CD1115 family n=1 Tax=Alicyclobacillus tolerans TaxID=90970 RepID=UPI001F1EAE28|nr:type IV secretory system conjugative DNA transfer family protein [Alicyclobacillus tolerans]MCF8567943.1 type IV secretory system conjugative DNA transfer family protein [Alicyclobacillus tolerans]
MERNKAIFRWITTGVFTLLVFLLSTTVMGAFYDFLSHIRSINLSYFHTMEDRAEHFQYVWWAIARPEMFTNIALVVTGGFLVWDVWRTWRATTDHRRKYKQRHGYAAYGTSHWQEKAETRTFYHHDNNGFLLGDYDKTVYMPLPDGAFQNPKIASYTVHPFSSELNQQYLVMGPPGSKKTTGFILPNIFHLSQQGVSMVVTDPKGELYELTAEYLRERGYNVVVLDYISFKYGQRQNYIQYIFEEKQYAEVANMYLNATRNDGDKRDFWEGKAQELLTALIGFVHQAYGSEGTFTKIFELIPYFVSNPVYIVQLFDEFNIKGAPRLLLNGILAQAGSENLMANIIGTLTEKLNLFTLSNVQAHTSTTDYDLTRVTREKTVVFVWISVEDATYAPLVSVFWSSVFNIFYKVARENGGKVPIPVAPLIDEMANIGKIAGFDTKLTTMRSMRIFPMMIWHSYPQLKLKYGQDYADVFLSSCDTHVLLAANDLQTAELFSKAIGDTTIETQSRRGSRAALAEANNVTNQFTGRRLLQPSEIRSLDRRFSIVLQSGRPPLLLNKVQYEYWKLLICPRANLNDLPFYGPSDSDEPISKLESHAIPLPESEDVENQVEISLVADSDVAMESQKQEESTDVPVLIPPAPTQRVERSRWT